MLNVSERSVKRARKIQDQGVDELKEADHFFPSIKRDLFPTIKRPIFPLKKNFPPIKKGAACSVDPSRNPAYAVE
jgi:hypothetical protein